MKREVVPNLIYAKSEMIQPLSCSNTYSLVLLQLKDSQSWIDIISSTSLRKTYLIYGDGKQQDFITLSICSFLPSDSNSFNLQYNSCFVSMVVNSVSTPSFSLSSFTSHSIISSDLICLSTISISSRKMMPERVSLKNISKQFLKFRRQALSASCEDLYSDNIRAFIQGNLKGFISASLGYLVAGLSNALELWGRSTEAISSSENHLFLVHRNLLLSESRLERLMILWKRSCLSLLGWLAKAIDLVAVCLRKELETLLDLLEFLCGRPFCSQRQESAYFLLSQTKPASGLVNWLWALLFSTGKQLIKIITNNPFLMTLRSTQLVITLCHCFLGQILLIIIMLRLIARTSARPLAFPVTYGIKNWKLPASELDSAGLSGFLESKNEAYLTFSQKISLYYGLDEWTRELLVTLSADLNCGIATSIIIATIAIKTLFLYPTLKSQIQGLRQAELKQLSDVYRERVRTSQMTGNKMLMAQATYDYKMGMKKKGINTFIPMLNLFQIPILFTWFFSLRYLSNLPEVYPQILTEGYLWFSDLSTYDPYFVLPVLAACGTSLSIARSPNLARNNLSMPFLAPYVKYLKFLPFASLAFTGFFPASINLYWFTLSFYQLFTTQLMYSKYIRRTFGLTGEGQQTKTVKFDGAVFVEEKQTSQQAMTAAETRSAVKPVVSMEDIKQKLEKNERLQVSEVKLSLKRLSKKKKEV